MHNCYVTKALTSHKFFVKCWVLKTALHEEYLVYQAQFYEESLVWYALSIFGVDFFCSSVKERGTYTNEEIIEKKKVRLLSGKSRKPCYEIRGDPLKFNKVNLKVFYDGSGTKTITSNKI